MRVFRQYGCIMANKNRGADLALAIVVLGMVAAVGLHERLRVVGYWIFLAVVAAAVIGVVALALKNRQGR